MTRQAPQRLYRAVLVDSDGLAHIFVLYAQDADDAADQAEYQTGMDCAIVDDVTPARRKAA